jgi:hypothetical protein
MAALPQGIRDEHRELGAHIELLRTVADSIGSAPTEVLREGVGQAYIFLIHQLIPHAQAEEQVLYPTVARLLRALEATETMSRDHLEVIRLTEELEALWCLLRLILPAQILGSIILPKEVVHSIDGIEYGSHIYRRSACIESLGH